MTIAQVLPIPTLVLLCRSGGRLCAFDVAHVRETMRALPVEAVPEMPPFVLGMAMIRGVASPVLDLACLVGQAPGRPARRFVTLRLEGRALALALDEVIGIRAVAAGDLAAVAPLLQDADAGMVQAIATLDEQLMVVLRAGRLLTDAAWRALAAAESAA